MKKYIALSIACILGLLILVLPIFGATPIFSQIFEISKAPSGGDYTSYVNSSLAASTTGGPTPHTVWCDLIHSDVPEIRDAAFLAYLHFCTSQAIAPPSPTDQNATQSASPTDQNSTSMNQNSTSMNQNSTSMNQNSTQIASAAALIHNALFLILSDVHDLTQIVSAMAISPSAPANGDPQVNNDPVTPSGSKRTQSEVSIAVSGQNIVVGYNDDQDPNTSTYSGYSYSNDGGKTWVDGGGILPNPGDFDANDPSVVTDSKGNFYFSMLIEDSVNSKVGVAKSIDGGKTFGNPVITDSAPAASAFLDKDYMAVGKNPSNPSQDIIHITYTRWTATAGETVYKRSLDGGLTWQDSCTLNPGGDGVGAMPIVDSTGNTVYVFYMDFTTSKIVGYKNTNAGAGCLWTRVTDVGIVHPLNAKQQCGGIFAVWNGKHRATHIPVEAIGPNGNLYVVWNDSPDGGKTTQIVLFKSTDGGTTWIGPQTFTPTPGRDQFEPWIAVAPNGRITMIFYDRVNDPNNLKMDLYAVSSTDSGNTWQPNQRITPTSFSWGILDPPSDPNFFSCYFIGDYQGITFDSNNVANLAWSDGRVIASDGTPKPNVFYQPLVTTAPAPATVPSAPQNLQATAGNAQVSLSWTAPASNGGSSITNYNIYRSTSSGTETLLTTVGNVNSYTDPGLTNGQTYFYTVTAVNSVGESVPSNEASATPTAAKTVPSAPQNLQASPGNARVLLSWTAPANNGGATITNYKIYRSTSSGTETLLTTVGNVNSYTNTGLKNGVTYFYKVTAVNSVGQSARSNEASATPTATKTVPSAPQNLQATAGNAQVSLSWKAPASNGGAAITNYNIYRSTSSGTETLLTTVGNVNSFTDTGLTNGQTYFYTVTAVNSVGESVPSNEASATPVPPATLPSAPTGLTATAAVAQINLSWNAPSNDGGSPIIGYMIESSTDGGATWSIIVSNTGSTATTYSDTTILPLTTYTYRVSAINSVGTSSPSNTASATSTL